MRPISHSALTIALIVALIGCAPETETGADMPADTVAADVDQQQVRDEIEATYARFESYVSNQNADSVATLYTSDGQLMPPGAPIASGENIRSAFQGMFDAGATELDLQTLEVEAADDFAYEVGRYNLTGPEGVEADNGKYIVIWKMEDGEWKIHRDIFNSSVAGQAAEGAE